jgi:proliferating cell nuclear antigen
MFKAVLSDVDLLKNSIPIIADIIDEACFRVDHNGISLLAPDRTMVSIVDFRLLSSVFDSYSVEQPLVLGMNMAGLAGVLKRIKGTDKITLEAAKDSGRLKVTVEGNGKRVFEIPLIDIKEEKAPVDKLSFGGKVEIDSAVIEDGVSDADVIGDSVVLEAAPELFRMYSRGDVSATELELKKTDPGLLKLDAHIKIRARYPLEYLKKMVKASKLAKQATIEWGNDYPMKMAFSVQDKVHLSFILAPRVEE